MWPHLAHNSLLLQITYHCCKILRYFLEHDAGVFLSVGRLWCNILLVYVTVWATFFPPSYTVTGSYVYLLTLFKCHVQSCYITSTLLCCPKQHRPATILVQGELFTWWSSVTLCLVTNSHNGLLQMFSPNSRPQVCYGTQGFPPLSHLTA